MSDTPTPLDLEAIRARWSKATPGPWRVFFDGERYDEGMCQVTIAHRRDGRLTKGCVVSSADMLLTDARAIAAAPKDITALLSEVKQLQEQRDRLAADAQRWANIRSTVTRLDAIARPGLPMGDDDIEGLVLQILEHAARKSGRTHSSSALPGAINVS